MDVSAKITRLREGLGLDQSQFAELCKVSQSTVSKWESGQQPRPKHLIRLAELAGERLDVFIGSGRQIATTDGIGTYTVRVVGSVQAGSWMEAVEWPAEKQIEITVPLEENVARLAPQALRVDGPSMNRVFNEGDFVLCVQAIAYSMSKGIKAGLDAFRSGDFVVVHRRGKDGLIEATIKEFVIDDDGRFWLWPRSNRPEYQQPWPVPLGTEDDDGDDLRIAALVVGHYKALRTL